MKSIIYTIYRNGSAGLSNLVMSCELGVVLAGLTDRVLILKGNKTPQANVVKYGEIVRNTYPSRVTDLIDLGVPWIDADHVDIAAFVPQEISDKPAWESVFYFPPHLSTQTGDFRAFVGRRKSAFTVDENLQHVPAIAYSGGPEANTLSFYSSFFYLDEPTQIQAYEILRNMKPKPEYAAYAKRVADELGRFNAVHVRRGDFKTTVGVTTLDRTGAEAVEALDHHFSRADRLVILTDEANDPFFDEIKAAYKDTVFLDRYMLENFGPQFQELPAHDSIALAYLSQLVASRSDDFIGSMTSTFTSLIQRMRGNLGKDEPFKFLWNELPSPGVKLEPGRHLISDSIRLRKGVMVEERDGPYSWNRLNDRLNTGWMREWPESFLDEKAMVERTRNRKYAIAVTNKKSAGGSYAISFLGNAVVASSDDDEITDGIRRLFALMGSSNGASPIGEVRIEQQGAEVRLLLDGKEVRKSPNGFRLLRQLYREVASLFIVQNAHLVWLHAGCVASSKGAIVFPGSWGRGKSTLVLELHNRGWSFLSDDIVPFDPATGKAVPFPGTPQVRDHSRRILSRDQLGSLSKSAVPIDPAQLAVEPQRVSMIVFPHFLPEAETQLELVSPARAVGELLENCLSFQNNTDATIEALCALVEELPAYQLHFSDAVEAADVLMNLKRIRNPDSLTEMSPSTGRISNWRP